MLVEVVSKGITGKEAEQALERANVTVNKNVIPFDTRPLTVTSGIRVGTPAVTTRGMKEEEMRVIGRLIGRVLRAPADSSVLSRAREEVIALTKKFPLYQERLSALEKS